MRTGNDRGCSEPRRFSMRGLPKDLYVNRRRERQFKPETPDSLLSLVLGAAFATLLTVGVAIALVRGPTHSPPSSLDPPTFEKAR